MTAKLAVAALGLVVLIPLLIVAGLQAAFSAVFGSSQPTAAALADIPADYLALYRQAAPTCPGLDWTVLAAIGKIETDHGRSTLPGVSSGENAYGAGGVMQILQPTWDAILARHDIPPGGATPPSRYNPHDAIYAATFYLCDNRAPDDLHAAIFAYNHSDTYVEHVLTQAADYHQTGQTRQINTTWPREQASLTDPSGTGGRVTPRMSTLYQALHAAGAITDGATCWDPHPQNPDSDHPLGKACDIFFNPRNNTDVSRGWQTAQWLTSAQAAYGVHYLIWQGQIWTAESPTWTTYKSDIYGCPNPANVTGCHYDHIHISVY